jgi:hypothetical protein
MGVRQHRKHFDARIIPCSNQHYTWYTRNTGVAHWRVDAFGLEHFTYLDGSWSYGGTFREGFETKQKGGSRMPQSTFFDSESPLL